MTKEVALFHGLAKSVEGGDNPLGRLLSFESVVAATLVGVD